MTYVTLSLTFSLLNVFVHDISCSTNNSWHADDDVYKAVKDFHDKYALVSKMDKERRINQEVLNAISDDLRKKGIGFEDIFHRFEYIGSSYEGVKVEGDGCEFDILVILRGGKKLEASSIPSQPGYYHIKASRTSDNPFPTLSDSDGLISPFKTRQEFIERLDKIRKDNSVLKKYKIQLVNEGPVIKLDIYKDNAFKNIICSVKLVLAFEIDGNYYIVRPHRDIGGVEDSSTWRISYSLKEKAKLADLDRGNGCRKQVLRVCKVISLDQPELKIISSYILKNVLFFEDKDHPDSADWNQTKLGQRTLGLWERLEQFLDAGFMPNFFNSKLNLIENMSAKDRDELKDRITSFCNDKTEFMKILKRKPEKEKEIKSEL